MSKAPSDHLQFSLARVLSSQHHRMTLMLCSTMQTLHCHSSESQLCRIQALFLSLLATIISMLCMLEDTSPPTVWSLKDAVLLALEDTAIQRVDFVDSGTRVLVTMQG